MRSNHLDTFDPEGSGSSASRKAAKRVSALKAFVVAEQAHLLERHRFGLGGREIARGRADLVDLVVARASRSVAQDLGPTARDELSACAIVALGGYGRRELSPESDVDVLLLYPESLTAARRAFVESVLRILWDVGLEVGHSVRSIDDCVDLGRSDLHARNAMSEARLVAGDPALYGAFEREMGASVYRDDRANRFFLEAMRAEVAGRRARYGAVVGILEPNLKEGAGGLRDLHVMGWFGLARYGLLHLEDLARADLLSPAEYRQALRASDALLRIRNEAHFQTGRRADLLSFELQPAIAAAMGYSDRHFATAAERFMRDLYRRTEELRRVSEAFLVRSDFWSPPPRKFLLRWNKTVPGTSGQRYRIRDGELFALPGEQGDLGTDPLTLFEVFRVAQRQGVSVSGELREQVRARLSRVDRRIRHSPDAAHAFLEILREGRGAGAALRSMHDSGLLARYLPEFRRITFMVQHDHYHRYTIDEHTLRVVGTLDRIREADDSSLTLLKGALEQVEDRGVLTLSALLHDIGKGRGAGPDHASRGAAIAKRVSRRLGLTEEKIEDVTFLVTKHLVMSRTAQRRDLTDETLVRGFADTVGTEDRLNMLFVLTYADISGVAPTAWNDWKATLLNELYLKTLPLVTSHHAEPAHETRPTLEDRVLRHLSPEFLLSDVEAFLGHLPTRYRRVLPPEIIARHFDLVRELGSRPLVTDWRDSKKGPYTVLSVCARDTPGLLGLLAGALTGAGLDILSLDVFTHDDGIALDVFRVCEAMGAKPVQQVPEELREETTRALAAAVCGELDPAASVERQRTRQTRRKRSRSGKPAEVRFEPIDALGRTPIEVRVDDEPGVLYRIASTLSALGLDISFAKVATEKNQALDVFYVERTEHAPVTVGEHENIRAALLEALEGAPGAPAAAGS